MVRMWRETSGKELLQIPSQIDALLLLDRSVDLLSPLITQLTYEGLIDEIFGINCSKSSHHFTELAALYIHITEEPHDSKLSY